MTDCVSMYSTGDSRRRSRQDRRVRLGIAYRQHSRQPRPRWTACWPAETTAQNRRGYQTVARQLLRRVPR